MTNTAPDVVMLAPAKARKALAGLRAIAPELGDASQADIVAIDEETGRVAIIELKTSAAFNSVIQAVTAMRRRSEEQGVVVSRLIADLLPPDLPVLSRGVLRQVERNASVLAGIGREFGLVDAVQLHEIARSKSTNFYSTASRWVRDGAVFGVEVESKRLYPGFQFDLEAGAPKPALAKVLATFDQDTSGWNVAVWFVSANSRLGGTRPVDVFETNTDEVVAAATAEFADVGP